MSDMLHGGENPVDPPGETDQVTGAGRHRGGKPRLVKGAKRKGWSELNRRAVIAYQLFASGPHAKDLRIGLVDSNARESQSVQIQACRAVWVGAGLTFRPLYASRDELPTDPWTGQLAEATVLCAAIVMRVQLHQSGTLFHSDASQKTERGWGLFREKKSIDVVETVDLIPCSRRGPCQGQDCRPLRARG